jgi:hypothetical protein
MTQQTDPFPELTLGTILLISPVDSGPNRHVMKLANGEWWEIHQEGTNGATSYVFGDAAIDHKSLIQAVNRIGVAVKGLSIGNEISVGVQIMALPMDAVVIHTGTSGKYVKTQDGLINDAESLVPYNLVAPGNNIWES